MGLLVRMITSRLWLGVLAVICPLVWALAFVAQEAGSQGLVNARDLVRGRDFMAFYLAGTLIRNGGDNTVHIYDRQLQQRAQDAILAPERMSGLVYFINPASVAVACSVPAALPYLVAFYVHTALMAGCFIAGMWFLKPHLRGLSGSWGIAAGVAGAWMPMAHTMTGGQNAALCFMLWSAAYAATVRGRQWLAGLALGILFFKPQYALPLLGLLLLRRQWVTCAVAAVLGGGHYVLGAMYCGADWPRQMVMSLGGYYRAEERLVSGHSHIAISEAVDYAVVQPLERAGMTAAAAAVRLAAFAGVAAVIVYLIWSWRRASVTKPDFGLHWALATAAALSISLHTQYYDGALLVLPAILILDHALAAGRVPSDGQRAALLAVYLLYPFVYVLDVSKDIGFQPLALVPLWIAWWADRSIPRPAGRHREGRAPAAERPLVRAAASGADS